MAPHRQQDLARKHQGLSCEHCGYDLSATVSSGKRRCPECGAAFSPDWLYSSEFESERCVRRRRMFLWGAGLAGIAALVTLWLAVDPTVGCLVTALILVGATMWLARWARS